jgi:hypothetical protein
VSRDRLLRAGLAAVAVTLYWSALDAPFVWDDEDATLRNPRIREVWPLSIPLSEGEAAHPLLNRPLASLSFAASHAVSGLEPRGFRVVNLLLHAGSALLVFGIVRRVLPRIGCGPEHSAGFLAFAIASLWLAHGFSGPQQPRAGAPRGGAPAGRFPSRPLCGAGFAQGALPEGDLSQVGEPGDTEEVLRGLTSDDGGP